MFVSVNCLTVGVAPRHQVGAGYKLFFVERQVLDVVSDLAKVQGHCRHEYGAARTCHRQPIRGRLAADAFGLRSAVAGVQHTLVGDLLLPQQLLI